jgi:MFS family permease
LDVTTVEKRPSAVSQSGWRREFALLWSGSAISSLGTMSATIAGPLLALSMLRSPVLAGWVAFASMVPSLLVYLPAGVVVDRLDRWWIMLVSQGIRGAAGLTVAGGLAAGRDPSALLVIGAAVEGTFAVVYSMAEVAVAPRIVPYDERSGVVAKNEARTHAAQLFGGPLGGLLCGMNASLPFLAAFVSCVISVVTLLLMRGREPRPSSEERRDNVRSFFSEIHETLLWIGRDAFLRLALIVCVVTNVLFQAVRLILVVMAGDAGLPSSFGGILLAAPGAGGVIGAILAPMILRGALKQTSPMTVIYACLGGWLVLLASIPIISHWSMWLLAWAGVGFIGAHMNVALATHQAMAAPSHLLGRVTGAISFVSQGASIPIGAIYGGYLISWAGARPSSWVVVGVLSVFVAGVAARRILLRGIAACWALLRRGPWKDGHADHSQARENRLLDFLGTGRVAPQGAGMAERGRGGRPELVDGLPAGRVLGEGPQRLGGDEGR